MLLSVKADYEKMLKYNDLKLIILERNDGRQSGIGNPVIKRMVLETLLAECNKQLKELI